VRIIFLVILDRRSRISRRLLEEERSERGIGSEGIMRLLEIWAGPKIVFSADKRKEIAKRHM